MYEREKAIGQFVILKKNIYALLVKSRALMKDIQEEADLFLFDNDFGKMDFKKIETLSKQLQEFQEEFIQKAARMKEIQSIYNIME